MTKIKNQQGFAHIALIAVVVVVAVVGFAGWKVAAAHKKTATKASTSPAVAAPAIAESQDEKDCNTQLHDKDLCKFSVNLNLKGVPYHIVMTNSGGSLGNSKVVMDVDAKQNMSMVSTLDGNEVTSLIMLNGETYAKDPSGSGWIHYPKDSSAAGQTDIPTDNIQLSYKDLIKDGLTYQKIGKEICGQLTCLKYEFHDPKSPSDKNYFWFDTKSYRIQRYSTSGSDGTTDMVFTYQNVKITAPSPVHEFSFGQ